MSGRRNRDQVDRAAIVVEDPREEPSMTADSMAPWRRDAAPPAASPTMNAAARTSPQHAELPGFAAGLVVASISQIERMIEGAVERAVREALADLPLAPSTTETPEKLLDAAACAEIAGVDMRTWRRLVNAGVTPPCLRLSNKIRRWSRRAIEEWARSGGASRPATIAPREPRPTFRRRESAFDKARKEGA